ncbi:XRN 5'-3' exonuclease [Indivirus ILV1]|uniref:XRN 5'-3' exonuclease n=1 Tax=Indivirus ILV1 TaxID=1977633 RepID=A0A1V0SD40_9VIRU|nr:XRN 5'-3' exonuclease [Indivirus ILV1]
MGIERFFSSIEENNITNSESSFTYKIQKSLDSSHLLIDFNSIIHVTSSTIIADLNYLLYQIINKSYKLSTKAKKIVDNYKVNINIDDELEYSDLIKVITKKYLDNIILEKVEEFIINMLNNFIINDKLETLYIAVDGVPNKSKMLEQKKRRFMGIIISELKNKIFEKHEDDLMKLKTRYLYEKNKFNWSKIYISPGTEFMYMLDDLLSSDKFKKKVKNTCKKLKTYKYSGTLEFGEGEKKIVDYVHKHKLSNIAVYSPDSDMTLLCLLLNNYFKEIKIIRHNQQQNNYDIIDVDLLGNNLYGYVANSIKMQEKNNNLKINKVSVIDDIVFVLTIFGNDFLPKLESFDVKYDFNRIIDKYIEICVNGQNIVEEKGKIKHLNQKMLTKFIENLKEDEGGNLQKKYMSSYYQNYGKLKKILGADQANFTKVVNDFLFKLRKFNSQIRSMKINNSEWLQDKEFIDKLIKLTHLNGIQIHNHNEFIDQYNKFFLKNNKLPQVRITFKRYSKSLKDTHHRDRLEKSLDNIDPSLKITAYDEEIYKLDNMIDEYVGKLNATPLDLGKVYINPKSYTWVTEKIIDSVKKYYYDFFGVKDINNSNPEMRNLINDYMLGLVWVFDYYYNLNANPSIWFYKYNHSPLLTQIYNFLKDQNDKYIEKLEKEIREYDVEEKEFFKPNEHLVYVSPIQKYPDVIPKEYNKKINKIDKINIDKITNEIFTNNLSDEIDCRGALFLNKCHVNELHIDDNIKDSFDKDKKFIKLLRN